MAGDATRTGEAMRIGIDLGGTKIEGVVLDAEGRERARLRRPTPRDDYRGTIAAIVAVVAALEAEAGGGCTIGVGTPGAISPATGLMKNCNSTCLNGQPLDRDLAAALGRAVRLANDADCFALSEAVDGAGADAVSVFGVILGTGVGGGLVYEKRLIRGPNAIAGEWGHNPLPRMTDAERPGPLCYCGRPGCIETFLSGPGWARGFAARTGRNLSAPEIVAAARAGDAAAAAALETYCERLARALGVVVNIFDPAAIVLGGGMSQVAEVYARVPALWAPHIMSDAIATRLLPPRFGDSSGVRGAAWLWNDAPAAPPQQRGLASASS